MRLSSRFSSCLAAGLLLATSLFAAGPARSAEAGLLVAAGAGYKRPVTELCAAFEKKTGIKAGQLYGNMAQVLTQAQESGQVALVVGDLAFLESARQVRFVRFVPLGEGRLVLAYARGVGLRQPEDLLDPRFARIAMPDPRNAVYGKAASEFLAASGLADKLQPRLMVVATVPQVSSYLVSGDVEAGFLNLTDVLGIQDKIGGYVEIERQAYAAIRIVGGVVQGHAADPAVLALEAFMASPEARAIMEKHGL